MERASRSAVGVGTAAIVLNKEGQILVGLRRGSHGEGTWGLPGGHIEFGEGTHYCAEREVYEETGLEVKAVKFAGSTNDYFEEAGKHYITNFVVTTMKRHEAMPKVTESDKCGGWNWVSIADLQKMAAPAHTVEEREELFLPLENFILQEKDLKSAFSIVTEDDRMRIDRAPHYDIAKGKIVRGFHFEPAKKKRNGHGIEMKV